MTYFSWQRSQSWSGAVNPVKHDKPWSIQTSVHDGWTPIVFTVKLPPEEEGWTLDQLAAKYPRPRS